MVPPQIGSYVPFAAIYSSAPIDAIPASAHRLATHTFVSAPPVPTSATNTGGPAVGSSLLRLTSPAEVVLIAVLFLLVCGLVALRVADALSERDVELSRTLRSATNAKPSASAAATTESSTASTEREPTSSPTDDHQSFEHYIAPETPSELLSDEGEVVRLLVANHGRLRQHRIADETGWSKSKVSRICSRMDADDTIEKSSVGRENVITLSDRSADDATQSDDVENPDPVP